jgi:hypothetical protein
MKISRNFHIFSCIFHVFMKFHEFSVETDTASMGEFQHLDDLSAFLKKTALCFTFIFAIARWKGLKD